MSPFVRGYQFRAIQGTRLNTILGQTDIDTSGEQVGQKAAGGVSLIDNARSDSHHVYTVACLDRSCIVWIGPLMLHKTITMMMMNLLVSFLFLVSAHGLAAATAASADFVDPNSHYEPAVFEVNDLLTGRRADELSLILETTGLLAVRLPRRGYSSDRASALQGLCSCQDQLAALESVSSATRATLNDPATRRTTLATATVGTQHPLPLAAELEPTCGQTTVAAMEHLRDDVASVSAAFGHALDRLLQMSPDDAPLLQSQPTAKHSIQYHSVSKIQASATHLEHFHIYQKDEHDQQQQSPLPSSSNKDKSLFWHTDAGLFLTFVPAMDCNSPDTIDSSFWMMNHHDNHNHYDSDNNNDPTPVQFPTDSVVVMLGAGAQHWLHTPVPLTATRHAVRMVPGQTRAWYGMMTLVPDDAIVQEKPQRKTFKDMQNAIATLSNDEEPAPQHGDQSRVSIGCGASPLPTQFDNQNNNNLMETSRRRLQHVNNPSDCNNQTNFFCWMSCLDIPDAERLEDYLDDGYSLYCMDPAVYGNSQSVAAAVEPCPFGVHNSNCKGEWIATDPDVPGYHFPGHEHHNNQTHNSTTPNGDFEKKWCYGGTSMYMDGFHWTHTTCVIYLFPEWVLSTRGKLLAASFGTVVFGAVLEFVIFQRRKTLTYFAPGYQRLTASALFYGTQLTMGYMIMLVIMTYSGALFLSTVLGLVGGHILFNSKDAVFGKKDTGAKDIDATARTQRGVPSDESRFMGDTISQTTGDTIVLVDQESGRRPTCCASPTTAARQSCCASVPEGNEQDADVPEGITPCCQNEL